MRADVRSEISGPLTELLATFARAVLKLVPASARKVEEVKELERLVDLADNALACPDCGGKGWDLFSNDGSIEVEVQKCDACNKLKSDAEAASAAQMFVYVCEPIWAGLKEANRRKMRFRREQRLSGETPHDD